LAKSSQSVEKSHEIQDSIMNEPEQCWIVTFVPRANLQTVLDALTQAGAGVVGEYTECAFVSEGRGRFRASDAANPAVGARGALTELDELRVETSVERSKAKAAVAALRAAHPYEEPVILLLPLLDADAL
jgi:hypothetical protein